MYNPLLDGYVADVTWYEIAEKLQVAIARSCLRSGNDQQAVYHLNVLDLIDSEASAYWREWGLDLYAGRIYSPPAPQVPAQEVQEFGPASNPILDLLA